MTNEVVSEVTRAPEIGASFTLRTDLALVRAGIEPVGRIRADVLASWRACIKHGLRPDSFVVGQTCSKPNTTTVVATDPVVAELLEDLCGTDLNLVVSDDQANIVECWPDGDRGRALLDRVGMVKNRDWSTSAMGTNSIGIATTTRRPFAVNGDEHFLDALTAIASASAPINADSGLRGSLTLVSPAASASVLMLSIARHAARHIEEQLAATAERSRRRGADPTIGWDSLTCAERRLAALVAEGLTNRAIADRLFISRHTVNSHVRNIFGKLDITSRVQLARVVMEHDGRAHDPGHTVGASAAR
jgi:DNA-binding CsgD family transcriptional regulator